MATAGAHAEPKHILIREAIREQATLRFAEHARLPSERSLAHRFGVARMTVRQAIDALVAEGVLYRRTRVGTFVSPSGGLSSEPAAHPTAGS